MPPTPDETRIIAERKKAAAAEREHERRLINEVHTSHVDCEEFHVRQGSVTPRELRLALAN